MEVLCCVIFFCVSVVFVVLVFTNFGIGVLLSSGLFHFCIWVVFRVKVGWSGGNTDFWMCVQIHIVTVWHFIHCCIELGVGILFCRVFINFIIGMSGSFLSYEGVLTFESSP